MAHYARPADVALLLTGMGADGADGMVALRHAGAETIAEAEECCVVFGMPKEAIARGGAAHVSSLLAIRTSCSTVSRAQPRQPRELIRHVAAHRHGIGRSTGRGTRLVVGIGDLAVSQTPDDVIVTHALGSRIAVCVWDPAARVAGPLHFLLPEAKLNMDRARSSRPPSRTAASRCCSRPPTRAASTRSAASCASSAAPRWPASRAWPRSTSANATS